MARGEGESGIKSHFVERVVKLPVVHVAWGYATNTYSHLKESNKLVNFTLTNAEKSVTFVAEQAKPVVLKFEKQIQAVDDLACKGLGTLEEKVPFITKPAEEILGDTRKLYNNTVHSRIENIRKYGTDRVKSVADYGLDKANAIFGNKLVQSMLTSVDGALVLTEKFVDHLLPPSDDEKKKDGQKNAKEVTPLVRLLHISNKLRIRVHNTLSIKLESAQERSIEILLVYPLQVIEFSKEHVDHVVKYLSQIWESFKEAGSDETDGEKSLVEQQLLHLGRMVSRRMASAYSSFIPIPPTEPSDTPADREPVRNTQENCLECSQGQGFVGRWNAKTGSYTPAYVHIRICIVA